MLHRHQTGAAQQKGWESVIAAALSAFHFRQVLAFAPAGIQAETAPLKMRAQVTHYALGQSMQSMWHAVACSCVVVASLACILSVEPLTFLHVCGRGLLIPPLGAVRSFTVRMWLAVQKFPASAKSAVEFFSSFGLPSGNEASTKAAGATNHAGDVSAFFDGRQYLNFKVSCSLSSSVSTPCRREYRLLCTSV